MLDDNFAMYDLLQRPLRDLRISVTDRCNLRCGYCMPRAVFGDDYPYLPRAALLNFEEIERVAQAFVLLGVEKIRLTGGEPLLRRGVEQLIERLAGLRTPSGKPVEIALTTNGVLLAQKARALKNAGLSRITVSLDSLNPSVFQKMSDSDVSVGRVLEGIASAQAEGLAPVKINMVVRRGVNEQEILPMVEHFRHTGNVLRFIEYMDVGSTNGWDMGEVVSAREIIHAISVRHPLQAISANYAGEVAARWRYADGAGEIGVIASVTQAFCQDCTRARLSTDGKLYTCLFAQQAVVDLRAALRQGENNHNLANRIAACWSQREDRYSQLRHALTSPVAKIEMSYIGG